MMRRWKNKGAAAAAAPDATLHQDQPVTIKIEPHQQKFPKMMEGTKLQR
jgi:hypothetical protein